MPGASALRHEVDARRLVEEREATGNHHAVQIGVAKEEARRLDDVRADRHGPHGAFAAEPVERRVRAVDRLREVIVRVVDVDDVDPVETESLEARLE